MIFDEVQEYSRALTLLKYFRGHAPEYDIVLLWLKDAGLVYQVNRIKKPDSSLSCAK